MNIRYPHIEVPLVGQNGNVYHLMGVVIRALKNNDVPQQEIEKFKIEVTAGDYNHALQTMMEWVTVT